VAALALAVLAVGCVGQPTSADDDDVATDDDSTPEPTPEPPAPLVEPSAGHCPDFDEAGEVEFVSDGVDRRALVYWPEGGSEDAPVVFFWHALGTTPEYWWTNFDLDALVEAGFIVVLPASSGQEVFEWDWNAGGIDATLYDDLRTCVVRELGADPRRITVAGFSAGAIWTSWLTMHRADTVATSFVMSGGLAPGLTWEDPARSLPVFLMSGGPTDTYGPMSFESTMDAFQDELRGVGSFAVRCKHNYGHTPGPGALDMLERWAWRHSYPEPSPWESGDQSIEDLGAGCEMVD
jgi:poly(3-hydroxybutyrate) depolymerase